MLASLALQNRNKYIFYYLADKINISLNNIYKYFFLQYSPKSGKVTDLLLLVLLRIITIITVTI